MSPRSDQDAAWTHTDDDGCCELMQCTLDKLARVAYDTANEVHHNGRLLAEATASLAGLLEMYRAVHPEQALALDRIAALEARVNSCCPPHDEEDAPYHYEPCTHGGPPGSGDGWSVKATTEVPAEQVEGRHRGWKIERHHLHESDESLPGVPEGPFVGRIVPSAQTATPMDFRSGSGPVGGGAQQAVSFRTFTSGTETQNLWPPDMTGATSGDVVLMAGNLWLKLSLDRGKNFIDLDFTTIFGKESTYGGWGSDPVIIYVPEIDCFVLYVQSRFGSGANRNANVVKLALASPADLRTHKGKKPAWTRQWHFTSATFGLSAWMDFPALTFGAGYLYANTNTFAGTAASIAAGKPDSFQGKLFWEVSLAQLKAGGTISLAYGLLTDNIAYGSPVQNIGDTNYWAAHVDNGHLRIYSSKGGDTNYSWRERALLANWPKSPLDSSKNPDIVSKPPDATDWISEDNRIIGATKVVDQLWFAWTAAPGSGASGGFSFPQAHIQIAKVDLRQDYKVVDQMQVWNAAYAFAYPDLTTNSNNEVGISCGWGGGTNYGSHVVGILGDFVLWYGEASDRTSTAVSPTRFGDYLHVRLAHPDTRFFSAFGYAVHGVTGGGESANYLYTEFGREPVPSPGLR
jgi:hypothetical protein